MRDPTRLFIINPHACRGQHEQDKVRHACFGASYLEGESVLAGAEPHVLHWGAADHHLSHLSAGRKHWSAEMRRRSFVWFLPRLQHNVHRVCTARMLCKAAGSCRDVHEVAVSKYGMMCSCMSTKGEHSHCESALGAGGGGTRCT